MKRFWGHVSAAFAAAGVILVTACAHNDESIFVRQVMAPPIVQFGVGAAQCLYTPDPTQPFLTSGVLDASLLQTYSVEVLVGNQLVPQGSAAQDRAESNRVELQGFIVRVTDANGNELRSFTRLASGFVDPSLGDTPSYGLIAGEILDSQSVQAAGAASGATKRLVSHFKVFGTTLGRQSVETGEFDYPIDICYGCLVSFPNGSQDNARATIEGKPNCKAPLDITTAAAGQVVIEPCFLGQDQIVDCRLCQGAPTCDPSTRTP